MLSHIWCRPVLLILSELVMNGFLARLPLIPFRPDPFPLDHIFHCLARIDLNHFHLAGYNLSLGEPALLSSFLQLIQGIMRQIPSSVPSIIRSRSSRLPSFILGLWGGASAAAVEKASFVFLRCRRLHQS